MGQSINVHSTGTEPRLFFRTITGNTTSNLNVNGGFQPSDEDKEKLQSTSFLKALDLFLIRSIIKLIDFLLSEDFFFNEFLFFSLLSPLVSM